MTFGKCAYVCKTVHLPVSIQYATKAFNYMATTTILGRRIGIANTFHDGLSSFSKVFSAFLKSGFLIVYFKSGSTIKSERVLFLLEEFSLNSLAYKISKPLK